LKKIPVIPECYKDLPDGTYVNSKEVAKMFGYKNPICLSNAEKNGIVPKRDRERVFDCSNSTSGTAMSKYWKLGTIRRWGK